MGKGDPFLLLGDLISRLFTKHLHVSTQRKGREQILGITPFFSDNLIAEPHGKLQDPYSKELGKQKMPQLMDKDQDTKDNNKRYQ